jgi:predicted MFS family arabinose efflux permease
MLPYSLWMNWITIFLVRSHGLSPQEANSRLAWIPPLFAAAGGLAGGVLGAKFAARGMALVPARLRAMLFAAVAMAVTAAAPFAPTPNTATALICWSFFWAVAFSVNIYVLPIDYFGPERAATGIAALTFAYGLMQTVASPAIGRAVDLYGFQPVCVVISAAPISAWLLLRATARLPQTA